MGFSIDQYPSAEEMAAKQSSQAAAASVKTSELLEEYIESQKRNYVSLDKVLDMLRIIPVALNLTDEQITLLNKLYPLSSFATKINVQTDNKEKDNITEKHSLNKFGYYDIDNSDEELYEIIKKRKHRML